MNLNKKSFLGFRGHNAGGGKPPGVFLGAPDCLGGFLLSDDPVEAGAADTQVFANLGLGHART